MSFKRILVAIDRQRPLNPRVFEQALDLAQKESASLMLFHCVDGVAGAEVVTPATPGIGLDPLGSGLDPFSSGLGLGTHNPFNKGSNKKFSKSRLSKFKNGYRLITSNHPI